MKLNSNRNIELLKALCIVEELKYLGKAQLYLNNDKQSAALDFKETSSQFNDLKDYIKEMQSDNTDLSFEVLRQKFQNEKTILDFLDDIEKKRPSYLNHRAYLSLSHLQQSSFFPRDFDKDITERFADNDITSARSLGRATSKTLFDNKKIYTRKFIGKLVALALAGITTFSIAKKISHDNDDSSKITSSVEQSTSSLVDMEKYSNYIDLLTQFQEKANDPDIDKNYNELQALALKMVKTVFIDIYNKENGTSYTIDDYKIFYQFDHGEGDYYFNTPGLDHTNKATKEAYKRTDKLLDKFTIINNLNDPSEKAINNFLEAYGDTISDIVTDYFPDEVENQIENYIPR